MTERICAELVCTERVCAERVRETQSAGFTLLELILAVMVLATSVVTVLYLRTDSVSRAFEFTKTRHIQKLAVEKLEDVMYGEEESLQGEFERQQDGTWEVTGEPVGGADNPPLYACTIKVTYPKPDEGENEYLLTQWVFFLPEESVLLASIEDLEDPLGGFPR